MSATPYLSIVLAGRNDDYGGDFNERLQNAVQWLGIQVEAAKLPVELLLVNYNPLSAKPSLEDAIEWPENRKYLRIRIVTVPSETHARFNDPEVRKTVPLYEYIAKNIGIRRAKADWIVGANPDIIFHPEIIRWLAEKKLVKTEYYRVDRCDFKSIQKFGPADGNNFLQAIREAVFLVFLKQNRYEINPGSYSETLLSKLRRRNRWSIWKDIQKRKYEKLSQLMRWNIVYDDASLHYHTHCSGDFMLMHRDHWFALNGHPENTYLSLHTDSLFVVMAAHLGLKETVLPWPVFHQDHGRRYDAHTDENPVYREMFRKFIDDSHKMEAQQKPIVYNGPDWGCAGENFPEVAL